MLVDAQIVLGAARAEGFELSGLTRAIPHEDHARHLSWAERGLAGEMAYLTDHRAAARQDPRKVFPEAKTLLCVGKLYKTAGPGDQSETPAGHGWVARYAWGKRDYHEVMGEALHRVAGQLKEALGMEFRYRVAVDTAPIMERSYARAAGLGWIGKNTCLINQQQGSWFFLGELLLPFEVDVYGQPPADRCGTCRRCIEACPTEAIVMGPEGWELDARLCISYWTIEARTEAPAELKAKFGHHIFGCDICQDVCPWNRKAPVTEAPEFQPVNACPPLEELDRDAFRRRYAQTPVERTRVDGYNRNVRVALENGGKKTG